MYYRSKMPKIVGEFDADAFHTCINEVSDGTAPGHIVERRLAREMGDQYLPIDKVAGIEWRRPFMLSTYGSCTTDGDTNNLYRYTGENHYTSPVDEWHSDDILFARILELPNVLTTASRYPTQFLVGRVALPAYTSPKSLWKLWQSEAGNDAIKESIEKGDAQIVNFKPGEVLKVPRGTLHKRDIPSDFIGYRYFMRLFPRINLTHSGTTVGRLRPFKFL